ncbi:DUF397 domain-containing protein [Frankia sp. AgB32]|uniref:DUF397 domain-containing protein n=1 Tax=Frankia sp. AgB32 TaxID=631119 RepID=UPI00200EB32A|nr:DUF397 domain-containing protein [Frankia sp. AgB32]MCK9898061.1 DUF397 domain-containing protein [Frankia sp. AgB32]
MPPDGGYGGQGGTRRQAPATLAWRTSSASNGAGGMCVEVALDLDGDVAVRHSMRPTDAVLTFTPAEWDAFLDGARNGEFDRERLRDTV